MVIMKDLSRVCSVVGPIGPCNTGTLWEVVVAVSVLEALLAISMWCTVVRDVVNLLSSVRLLILVLSRRLVSMMLKIFEVIRVCVMLGLVVSCMLTF